MNREEDGNPALDETSLIRRARGGDPSAERTLYEEYVGRVYRMAFRMAGDEALAQDLTQETFVRVFDRLSTFRGDAKLSTWIHSVARSVILNGLRSVDRHRRREIELDEARDAAMAAHDETPWMTQRVHRAIDDLNEDLRMTLILHDMEGYTHQQIGEAMEVPVGTSKARLSRARAQVRETLGLTEAKAFKE